MKILHVSGAKGWGGNEQQMMYILPELAKNEVDNLVFGINDSILKGKCSKQSISFIGVKDRKLNKWSSYSLLKKVIKDFQPDIIHLHTSDSLTFYVVAKLILGVRPKTVFSKKGMGTSSSFLSNLKYNFKGLDSIICVSNSVKRDLGKILNEKTNHTYHFSAGLCIWYNGAEDTALPNPSKETSQWIECGGYSVSKSGYCLFSHCCASGFAR